VAAIAHALCITNCHFAHVHSDSCTCLLISALLFCTCLQSIWCFENVMELARSKGLLTASTPVMCKPSKQVRMSRLKTLLGACFVVAQQPSFLVPAAYANLIPFPHPTWLQHGALLAEHGMLRTGASTTAYLLQPLLILTCL
jgi:hypothetical protein